MASLDSTSVPYPIPEGAVPRVGLTVVRGPGEGAPVNLRRAVSLIGSRAGCKVTLRHQSVAGRHCAIVNTGYEILLRDLVSESGTYLNDLPVECERLDNGDMIRIAEWEFLVRVEGTASDDDVDTPVDFEPARSIALQVADNGQLIKLRRDVCVIGRRPGCDVLIQHRRVSRAHALIMSYLGKPAVFDLLSENGVFVNDERVLFRPLSSGDVLSAGPARLRVVIPDVSARRPSQGDTGAGTATTVIPLEDDAEDKIDIRTAELDQRRSF